MLMWMRLIVDKKDSTVSKVLADDKHDKMVINKREEKITTWEELVEKFFCKFYLESYDREKEMLDEGNNWGIDPLEFISRVNSSFGNHRRGDGRTKKGTLSPRDQRHIWLRYQVVGYTEEIVHDFEQSLDMIFSRQVNRVHMLDFEGLTPDMRQDLAERMRMVLNGDILCYGMVLPDAHRGILSDIWVEISSGKDFLRGAPLYSYIRDPVRRLCHRLILYSISGRGQAPKKHVKGGEWWCKLSGGHFIGRLAHHFGLVSDNGLRGLPVMARELPLIDMSELAGEDAPTVDEGNQAYPAPVQASQPPPPPPTAGRTMPQRLGILEEEIQGLHRNVRSLCGLMECLMTDQGRVSTWMVSCMTQLIKASGQTYRAFDGTF
ncbi:hypothetical protein Tco_0891337 [Tanacetum coccineum]|uniref:Uncharacterized protein n=1 Tax=Tanacetum coccineum TaxID=301880 RepID=A0ABQ5C2N1_9ASTR